MSSRKDWIISESAKPEDDGGDLDLFLSSNNA
jgi:hypothetical protein